VSATRSMLPECAWGGRRDGYLHARTAIERVTLAQNDVGDLAVVLADDAVAVSPP
jgi:hypothetical protein